MSSTNSSAYPGRAMAYRSATRLKVALCSKAPYRSGQPLGCCPQCADSAIIPTDPRNGIADRYTGGQGGVEMLSVRCGSQPLIQLASSVASFRDGHVRPR